MHTHLTKVFLALAIMLTTSLSPSIKAQTPKSISSPDEQLTVTITLTKDDLSYAVNYKEDVFLEPSTLGLNTSIGNFLSELSLLSTNKTQVDEIYQLNNAKVSKVHYQANRLEAKFANKNGDLLTVEFQVSNNNVAFRYGIESKNNITRIKVLNEHTSFNLPNHSTTFITPQALPETGWMQTKPSYEEPYTFNEAMAKPSSNGVGYTFPALFKNGANGWLLISETGVDSHYVGSRLSEGNKQGVYSIEFPQQGENSGIGATYAAMALPAKTPWRTITVGKDLAPIVESTIAFDVVKPLYQAKYDYKMGRASWSWIVWQDNSINYQDQVKFIDLAAALNFEYVLIDSLWDVQIGRDKIQQLISYANDKGVDVLLWYNSNGWWNDAPQTPKHKMHNSAARQQEMKWLQKIGVKGLKVDFFGGDKQETIKLYEDILVDANEHNLLITVHGSTIPRGWERMYPNFVTSEAVLASENLIFRQEAMDQHAYNATLLPFTRNAIGAMDFAPVFLNKRLSRDQSTGTIRTTTDTFELASSILYQSPVQHFGLTPNNLEEQPEYVLDFLRHVPAAWDETRLVAGEPGSHVVMARRKGLRWYVVAVNGKKTPQTLTVTLPMLASQSVTWLIDGEQGKSQLKQLKVNAKGEVTLKLNAEGGAVLFN